MAGEDCGACVRVNDRHQLYSTKSDKCCVMTLHLCWDPFAPNNGTTVGVPSRQRMLLIPDLIFLFAKGRNGTLLIALPCSKTTTSRTKWRLVLTRVLRGSHERRVCPRGHRRCKEIFFSQREPLDHDLTWNTRSLMNVRAAVFRLRLMIWTRNEPNWEIRPQQPPGNPPKPAACRPSLHKIGAPNDILRLTSHFWYKI